MLPEPLVFFKECVTHFTTTGSVIPSSRWAAQALTNPLRATGRPQRILEIGPGTGAVTTKILKDMIDGDELVICEINSRFMAALKNKLKVNSDFDKHKDRITFFEGAIQALPEVGTFDVIICAIPFNNLPLKVVEEIFEKLKRLSNKRTHLSFFEYLGLREIGQVVSLKERRQRMREIEGFFDELFKTHETHRKIVWLNFTPINIYTLKFG